ncbi:MAG: SpaA isopeptide-forming pilin-related protein [Lachnospiraceae bacterium]
MERGMDKMKKRRKIIKRVLCIALTLLLLLGTLPGAYAEEKDMESVTAETDTSETEITEETKEQESVSERETTEASAEESGGESGATCTGSICGVLWYDKNSDGKYNDGEVGITNYPVYLYKEGNTDNVIQTVQTNAEGKYAFTDIGPGIYVVGVKSNELGTDYYLLPVMGVTDDNKLGAWSDDWDEKYSDALTIDTNNTVTNIDGGLRTPPGMQPMAAYTIDMSIVSAASTGYTYSSNTVTFTTVAASHTYTITGSTTTKTIIIPTGVTVKLVLSGVTINTATSPIRVLGTADMTLSGTNILTCTGTSSSSAAAQAGICVSAGAILTIDGTPSDTLSVTGGTSGTGIGGIAGDGGGTININGGMVEANGGDGGVGGAGIGSGIAAAVATGTINISGGTVEAKGGLGSNYSGAGIGGGGGVGSSYPGTAVAINISGGTVKATGGGNGTGTGYGGAGIGGGAGGFVGTIDISGGMVKAIGGATNYSGAGIGSGGGGGAPTINISGGTVEATGSGTRIARDIGYGDNSAYGATVITGGSVLPTRGQAYVSNPTNGTSNGNDAVGMTTVSTLASLNFSLVTSGSLATYTYSGTGHAAAGYLWLPYASVTTDSATSVSTTPTVVTAPNTVSSAVSSEATINGTFYMTNIYSVSSAYFQWGTTASYGNTITVADGSGEIATGSYTRSANLTVLQPGTTYHYRFVIVTNESTIYGADMTFTTPALAPSVDATFSITGTATLYGIYDLNGGNFTSGEFEISADGGSTWITLTSSSTPAVSSGTGVTVGTAQLDNSTTFPSVDLAGLNGGTTYQYRFTVTNSVGLNSEMGTFTVPYSVTEKFIDVSANPLDSSGLPDNIVYPNGSYIASSIPTTHTVGGSKYIYLGYKLDSYTSGDAYTSGIPSGVTITNNRDVYYIYAKAEGSIKVEKYEQDGTTLLPGAEFKLEKLTDTIASGGVVDTSFTPQMLSATSGTCTFSNLPEGVYQITETVAPLGYSLLKEPFEVEMPKGVTYASGVTPTDSGYLYSTTDSGTGDVTYYYYDLTYKVTDQAELQMPVAGSGFLIRYYLWIGIGILCIAGVSFAFWWRYRRSCKKMA